MNELQVRASQLRASVKTQYLPVDVDMLSKTTAKIVVWCTQVPVVEFYAEKYDLNMIKQYFVEKLADTCTKVKVATHGSKTRFIITLEFKFLDVINYLVSAISHDKWAKAYGCKQSHCFRTSGLTAQKLAYQGLPDYPAWCSRQYLLTLQEWRACKDEKKLCTCCRLHQ